MLEIILQVTYRANWGLALIDASLAAILLYIIVALFNRLLPEQSQIPQKVYNKSALISTIIIFGIIVGIRYLFELLGYWVVIFRYFNNEILFFALMITLFYQFLKIFLGPFGRSANINVEDIVKRRYDKFFKLFIYTMWIIAGLFLSIDLLQIELEAVDVFYLGFLWIGATVLIDVLITSLFNRLRSKEKRLPKTILRKAEIIAIIVASVVWSVQLFFFEIYLKRAISQVIIGTLEFMFLKIIIYVIMFLFGIIGIGSYAKKRNWSDPYIFALLISFTWFMVNLYLGIGFYFFIGNYLLVDIIVLIINIPIELYIVKKLYNLKIIESLAMTIMFNITLAIIPTLIDANIAIPEQDIRVLFGVVSLIYFIALYLALNFKILPSALLESQEKITEAFALIKEEDSILKEIDRSNIVLDVNGLTTYFYTEEGVVRAVEDVTFQIFQGETLGLVGETGCGKSVTALSILQVIRPPGKIEKGNVFFGGEDLLQKSDLEMAKYRGKDITMIFQDPLNSINPVFKIGDQIAEVFLLHLENELLVEASKHPGKSIYSIAREWSVDLLRNLNIPFPEVIFDRYPHELSGGMRQRVQIAMALACGPKLLIADEPTTALDVTIQNQILKLMKELKQKFNTSILFITHDLRIISKMCDRVAVMYSGYIVEYGELEQLFTNPYHPYTRGLLGSIPVVGKKRDLLEVIPGMVPNLVYPPSGCRFHPRCKYCFEPCNSVVPESIEVEPNYIVACHLYDPKYKPQAKISIEKVEKSKITN